MIADVVGLAGVINNKKTMESNRFVMYLPSKPAFAAPHQGLPVVSEITWEGCCLHKQEKLTLSLLEFKYIFATDCTAVFPGQRVSPYFCLCLYVSDLPNAIEVPYEYCIFGI